MSTKFIVELPDGLDIPEAAKMAYVKTAIQCWGRFTPRLYTHRRDSGSRSQNNAEEGIGE